ncbi:glycosyltransferase [Citreimonas salinaria]|uniref:Glycosyltransferase, GT2 family n=1 Tax=Citreimonas salinaria TaxID=321339 RepID=A0A1H3F5P6_9RHOB|nr:glycosyltransferase [Citreimonas salinaria]SDX86167.1 Glycosyltransferase, GT2 family [Citreimonas salinaria]
METDATAVDAVLIGRNEGARLVAALDSLRGQVRRVVYVDSGSADGSVAAAEAAGATVVRLDRSAPFSAARGRNAGFAALDAPGLVLFIDGDCALVPGFVDAARARLAQDPRLGLVTGWREEVRPGASLYNRLCDWEWHRPAGPITSCGGDILVRAGAWRSVDGQRPDLIAGEDEEFCLRLASAGWRLERLPLAVTRHDAAMTRFSQWWRRATRAGHAFAQVGRLHPRHWRAERRRVLFWALILPAAILLAVTVSPWLAVLLALAYPVSGFRIAAMLRRDGVPARNVPALAALLVLSKCPNLLGMATFWTRRLRGRAMTLIEYK